MDRFELLRWLIQRERDGNSVYDATTLMREAGGPTADWGDVARAAGELMESEWLRARFLLRPGEQRVPDYGLLTAHELQGFTDFRVTERGYAVNQDANPQPSGPVFNISNSQINQLAAGDINNINIQTLLTSVEQALEHVEGTPEAKAEARGALTKMRAAATGIGTGAAGGVLGAALRAALGLP